MADIDKSLSELGTSVKIEGPDQQVELEKQEEALKEPVQVTPTEDGGVELDFDPSKVNIEDQPNHFDNLAELLPDDICRAPAGALQISGGPELCRYPRI